MKKLLVKHTNRNTHAPTENETKKLKLNENGIFVYE